MWQGHRIPSLPSFPRWFQIPDPPLYSSHLYVSWMARAKGVILHESPTGRISRQHVSVADSRTREELLDISILWVKWLHGCCGNMFGCCQQSLSVGAARQQRCQFMCGRWSSGPLPFHYLSGSGSRDRPQSQPESVSNFRCKL